ncbi:GMP synthase (glutamine-hydrolyzing), partial [Bacteroidota bacterium]
MLKNHETILIIDFGSQYTQLITRRVREANIYSEVHPHTLDISYLDKLNLKGIILSGGPMSVYDEGASEINKNIYNLNVPVLGICYGLYLICKDFGGKV